MAFSYFIIVVLYVRAASFDRESFTAAASSTFNADLPNTFSRSFVSKVERELSFSSKNGSRERSDGSIRKLGPRRKFDIGNNARLKRRNLEEESVSDTSDAASSSTETGQEETESVSNTGGNIDDSTNDKPNDDQNEPHQDTAELTSHASAGALHNKGPNSSKSNDDGPELPPCNEILLHDTPEQRCHHAQNCDGEDLMTSLLPWAFCTEYSLPLHKHEAHPNNIEILPLHPILLKIPLLYFLLATILLLLLTLLLFRLLASTAENYFSPALEMMSCEFQIPPALAGVTLLALGNGAPDVSAVVNAIRADGAGSGEGAGEGLMLSLGELTGGGMFVQSVVVGRIVFLGSKNMVGGGFTWWNTLRRIVGLGGQQDGKDEVGSGNKKGEKGVKCREELLRDISMYAISAGYVYWMCGRGVIYYRHVIVMFLLYGCYVGVVLAFELRRYFANVEEDDNGTEDEMAEIKESTSEGVGSVNIDQADEEDLSLLNTTSSIYDEEQTLELSKSRTLEPLTMKSANEQRMLEPPVPNRPTNNQRMLEPLAPHQREMKHLPGSKHSTRILRVVQKQQERQRQRRRQQRRWINERVAQDPPSKEPTKTVPTSPSKQQPPDQRIDRSLSSELVLESVKEIRQHFREIIYTDLWLNTEISKFERFCQFLELPFTVMRKFVTPIPCEGEYNRSMVAYSIACSPFWICFYFSTKMDDYDPFCTSTDEERAFCFPSVLFPCIFSFVVGCAVLKYAPATPNSSSSAKSIAMPLHYQLPIALYGFVIAATWIDVISDELVNLLEFLGVICRIPAPIMGMTVLAWGNSVGDFTTNGALAMKGLADMSMAACFAGPSFNLLIGLGCGLLTQKELLLSEGLPIALMPSVELGFVFLLCNCFVAIVSGLWHEGYIPSWHGYVFFAMYFGYMTMNSQHLLL